MHLSPIDDSHLLEVSTTRSVWMSPRSSDTMLIATAISILPLTVPFAHSHAANKQPHPTRGRPNFTHFTDTANLTLQPRMVFGAVEWARYAW